MIWLYHIGRGKEERDHSQLERKRHCSTFTITEQLWYEAKQAMMVVVYQSNHVEP